MARPTDPSRRTVSRQRLGRAAEEAAARYLETRGWRLLGRNVRVGRGELDIIARRGPVLAFVEVKARRTHSCGAPEDAVGAAKRRQVARLAELWLAARPWAMGGVRDVRFDIIAVDLTSFPAAVRHLAAAFTGD
jgi:putative endonuclease